MGSTLANNSVAVLSDPSDGSPTSAPRQRTVKTSISPGVALMIVCALLGLSAGHRFWRDHYFQALRAENAPSPFPLKDLPTVLDSWRAIEGSDVTLEPDIVRTTGSSDYIMRTYQDDKSGEVVAVLVIYGLATGVSSHIPEACYPGSGYDAVGEPTDHELSVSGSNNPVRFRMAYYAKAKAGIRQYQEVFYTFRHNGQWSPDVASRWKSFRYLPGMFKIQLQRPTTGLGEETVNSPAESLLRELVEEIDRRSS